MFFLRVPDLWSGTAACGIVIEGHLVNLGLMIGVA
jgi:hypothetical protein